MPATGDSLTMDDYRRIIKSVIENSDKDSWWYRWSKFTAHSHMLKASHEEYDGDIVRRVISDEPYRMATDEQVQMLCEKAVETAEEHAENLSEYVAELDAEVAKGRPLEKEYRAIVDYGPSGPDKAERLDKWMSEHGGFTPYKLHESEFLIGYCRGVLNDAKPIPMPQHIKAEFERFSSDVSFGVADGKEVAFSRVSLSDSSLVKNKILSPETLGEYFFNPATNKPYSNQQLKELETDRKRKSSH